jgi:hypothetical protein
LKLQQIYLKIQQIYFSFVDTFQKDMNRIKEVLFFATTLSGTKTPHLILPNRTQSPPTSGQRII